MRAFVHRHPNLMCLAFLAAAVLSMVRVEQTHGEAKLFHLGALIFDSAWCAYWYNQTGGPS